MAACRRKRQAEPVAQGRPARQTARARNSHSPMLPASHRACPVHPSTVHAATESSSPADSQAKRNKCSSAPPPPSTPRLAHAHKTDWSADDSTAACSHIRLLPLQESPASHLPPSRIWPPLSPPSQSPPVVATSSTSAHSAGHIPDSLPSTAHNSSQSVPRPTPAQMPRQSPPPPTRSKIDASPAANLTSSLPAAPPANLSATLPKPAQSQTTTPRKHSPPIPNPASISQVQSHPLSGSRSRLYSQ